MAETSEGDQLSTDRVITHLSLQRSDSPAGQADVPSTPKKLLGSLLEGKSEVSKLEEEVMSSRLKEVEAMAELKELRLKVMDLETQTHVYHNQLKRQGEDSAKLSDDLEECKKREAELQTQLRSVWLQSGYTVLSSQPQRERERQARLCSNNCGEEGGFNGIRII